MKKKKESRNIYDKNITYENILASWNIVRKTCKNKKEVLEFSLNLHANLMNIYNTLKNKSYNSSSYRTFMIFEPKPRLVMSQSIFDKIVNHFIASYYLLPYLEKSLLDLNVATRVDKGSSYAMKLMKKYVNEMVINEQPNEIYCLKIDISKYFYSIDHDILIKKLECQLLDKDVVNLIKRILSETNKSYINKNISYYNNLYGTDIPFYFNNKGLSIGAVVMQFSAIFNVNDITHIIVEKLKCRYLVVYMDDIFILDTDKEKLKYVWKKINKEIEKLKLKVNKKSNLYRLNRGVDFLGYHYKYFNYKMHISCKKDTYCKVKRKLDYLEKHDLFKYKRTKACYYGYFKVIRKLERDDFSMKNIEIYDAYKVKYPNTLVLVKEGVFYSAYRDDANIIWNIFGYKHLDNKVSFGQFSYDKVINELVINKISFCIVDKEREYYRFDGDSEIYNSFLNIANKVYEKKKKEDMLIARVRKILHDDSSKYGKILSFLNNLENKRYMV